MRDSDSDEDLLGEDTSDCEDVPQTQSSSSGDHMPRSQSISNSDSGPEPLDWSDFDTDKEYWSTDSETEQHDEGHGGVSFEEDLRQWAVHNKTTHRSVNELLLILRKQGHLLPLDARTLLATPQRNTTEDKCGGQYAYYGLEKGICRFLGQAEAIDVNLIVNIDGIPLFKSSGVQFWPILAKLEHSDPFIVAIFCGQSKPSPLEDYLKDFLTEYKQLQNNGLIYKGQTYNVHVKALVCDAPARAYLKCIKGHNSYEGCERCTVRGAQVERRMVFNDLDSTLRTDEAFSRMDYANHQTSLSPLSAAGIPCVSSCALDYMHMVILGVVRRMLSYMTRGPKICRISFRQKEEISQKLIALRGKMPSEFVRQPRGLHDLDRWKATELRQFLLYTGPVVLKNVVSPDMYKHFLSLTVAMSMMLESDERRRNAYLQYAQDLLKHFVQCSAALYGKTFPVYNVHGLVHLHEDVRHFKTSLNEISCFPFENYLQEIKKHVRSGRSPLEQVTRRLSEIEHSQSDTSKRQKKVFISVKERDSCFLLRDESFAFIRQENADRTLLCDILHQRHTSPLFQTPCSSKLINIVCTRDPQPGTMKNGTLVEADSYRKVACLPQETGGYVLIPLRHDLEPQG